MVSQLLYINYVFVIACVKVDVYFLCVNNETFLFCIPSNDFKKTVYMT